MKVVELFPQSHITGNARCIGCGHKWEAVSVPGTAGELECPSCHAYKGVMLGLCTAKDKPIYVCDCGNDLYFIHPDGMMCANCGVWAKGF